MKMPCSACIKFKAQCDYSEFAKNFPTNRAGEHNKVFKSELGLDGRDEVTMLKERLMALEEAVKRNTAKRRSQVIQSVPELKASSEAKISFSVPLKVPDAKLPPYLKDWGPFRWILMVSLDPVLHSMVRAMFKDKPTMLPIKTNQIQHKVNHLSQGLLSGSPLESLAHLRQQMQDILPNTKVLWLLVDRFFSVVYPYAPVLDESTVRALFASLVGPQTLREEPVHVLANDELDFFNFGILLMVLRLAHLSLTDYKCKVVTSSLFLQHSMTYLSHYNIPDKFAQVAQKCLTQYNLFEDVTLEAIQLLTLICVHNKVNPEGFGSDFNNRTLSAMLYLMAHCRRINREQYGLGSDDASQKQYMLSQKIWYTLLLLDATDAAFSGSTVTNNPDSYDIKLPVFQPAISNVNNLETERILIESFEIRHKFSNLIAEGAVLTGTLAGDVPIKTLMEKVSDLEEFQAKIHEKIRLAIRLDPVNESDSFYRNHLLCILLNVQYFLFGVYTHVYFNHLKKKEFGLAANAETKLITSMTQNILPLLPMLLGHVRNPFAGSTDLFSMSMFINCTKNITFILVSLSIKYKSQFASMKCNNNHQGRMKVDPRYSNLYEALEKYVATLDEVLVIIGNFHSQLKNKSSFVKKLDFGHKQLHGMLEGVQGSSGDKAYIRTSSLFLEGSNHIIREGIDRAEFTTLRQRQAPLEHSGTTADYFDNRVFQGFESSAYKEFFDVPLSENIY